MVLTVASWAVLRKVGLMFVYTAYSRAVYLGINKVTVTIMSPAVITVFVKDVAKAIFKAIGIRAVQRVFCSFRLADVNGSHSDEISSLVARICAVGEWSLPARYRPFGATVGRSPTRSGEVGTWSC